MTFRVITPEQYAKGYLVLKKGLKYDFDEDPMLSLERKQFELVEVLPGGNVVVVQPVEDNGP